MFCIVYVENGEYSDIDDGALCAIVNNLGLVVLWFTWDHSGVIG